MNAMRHVCPCGAVKVGEVWLGEGWTGGDYAEDRNETETHGMCPECMEKYREALRRMIQPKLAPT